MAKTTTAKKSSAKSQSRLAKTAPRKSSGGSRSSAKSEGINGAADALVKLLESPLVAELLALGASAALATLTAQRFGRGSDGSGTRRALKAAVKSAGTAMGQRLSTEFDEIKKSAKARRGES